MQKSIQLNAIEQEYGEKDSGAGEPDEKDGRVGRQWVGDRSIQMGGQIQRRRHRQMDANTKYKYKIQMQNTNTRYKYKIQIQHTGCFFTLGLH